jgi:hypothetical protein
MALSSMGSPPLKWGFYWNRRKKIRQVAGFLKKLSLYFIVAGKRQLSSLIFCIGIFTLFLVIISSMLPVRQNIIKT